MFLMASFNTLKLSYKKINWFWRRQVELTGFFGKVVKLSGPFSALVQTN